MIEINPEQNLFTLQTRHTSYQIRVEEHGIVLHTYYGKKIPPQDLSYLWPKRDRGFSPQPYENPEDRTFSLDTTPQEYPGSGNGDFHFPAIEIENPDGSHLVDFRYTGFEILDKKSKPEGMPSFRDDEQVETLRLDLEDPFSHVKAELYYSLYPDCDLITRFAKVINGSDRSVHLRQISSLSLDLNGKGWDWIHFDGAHARERMMVRTPLHSGLSQIGSLRGTSSHQHNPFVILAKEDCHEQYGECLGIMLVYSGNFEAKAQVDQFGMTRVTMGIHPWHFRWILEPEQSFTTPEAAMIFSASGLQSLSHRFHDALRQHLIQRPSKEAPVLLNSWEGVYFDLNEQKLLELAKEAKELGVDLFVLDDGWFGKREDDTTSLGDWYVNRERFPEGLEGFGKKLHEMGLDFGLWVEPEMISEDSDLYRAHPDYVLQVADRPLLKARSQMVLDFSRQEVREAIYEQLKDLLKRAEVDYLKWDMNRSLAAVWSASLPSQRQGELYHRYVLGVYDFLDKLKKDFPELLIEGCSGGGGRFDAGMLYYTPQIWTSDNTDAIDRLAIQHGTSFGYPVQSMGAHVSASPNHQSGRETPLHTRAVVALSGTFGYELDPRKLSPQEKEEVKEQIRQFKEIKELVDTGDYYRLSDMPREGHPPFSAWQIVSKDKKESLLFFVRIHKHAADSDLNLRLRGLDETLIYQDQEGNQFSGAVLMNAGLPVPDLKEYEALLLSLRASKRGEELKQAD